MSKLYFRYGTMNSAKTLNLLAVYHNYLEYGKRACLVKPIIDTRSGEYIETRAGLKEKADILLRPNQSIGWYYCWQQLAKSDCVLIDEVQFLSEEQVSMFRGLANLGVPVIAYGLRTDSNQQLFPASAKLLALADSVEELKTICARCHVRKAVFNIKIDSEGKRIRDDKQIDIGGNEKYSVVCARCLDTMNS